MKDCCDILKISFCALLILHAVAAPASGKEKVSLKDRSGRIIDTLKADRITNCGHSLYLACDGKFKKTRVWRDDGGSNYGYVDKKVLECRKARFFFAFSDGFKPLHKDSFESASCFPEGTNLLPAAKDGKWGLIRKQDGIRNGEYFLEIATALPFKYDRIGSQCSPFDRYGTCSPSGIFPVQIGTKWGYMDSRGTVLIEPRFLYADSFSRGQFPTAKVKVSGTGREQVDYQLINSLGDLLRFKDNTYCGRREPNPRVTESPVGAQAFALSVKDSLFPYGEPDGFDCRKWETESWFSGADVPREMKVTPGLTWLTYSHPAKTLYLWDIPLDSLEYEFSEQYTRKHYAAANAKLSGKAKWDQLVGVLFRIYGRVNSRLSTDGSTTYRWEGKATNIAATWKPDGKSISFVMESIAVRDWENVHILKAAQEGTLLMPLQPGN